MNETLNASPPGKGLGEGLRASQTAPPRRPASVAPEVLHQIRKGNFEALAKWWAELMRSPESLVGKKQWMANVACFRAMTQEFLAKLHHGSQVPFRDDPDTLMLTVRHMEQRLLDRIGEVLAAAEQLNCWMVPTGHRRRAHADSTAVKSAEHGD